MPGNAFIESAIASTDVLVHLGAGQCRELPEYQAARGGRVSVLVEAHPDLAHALKTRVANMRNTKVVNCAVSSESGERVLHAYNLPERSSLHPATGLKALYPGLRLLNEIPLTTRSATSLLEAIDPEGKQSVCLVIDTPGEELTILQSLLASDRVKDCQSVILKCARQSLYEGAATAADLRDVLETNGYETVAIEESEDPEFITLLLKRNAWKLESLLAKKALEEQREAMSNEIEAMKAERSALEEKLATSEAAAKVTIDSLNNELNELRATLDSQIESMKGERAALEERIAARETEARDAIDGVSRELDEQRQAFDDQILALKADRAALEKELEARVVRSKSELDESRRDLGVAMRFQALREADLKDLQNRYSSVLQIKKQQDELLLKLQQRLSVAAERLNQLSMGDDSEDRVARALLKVLSDGEGR